MVSDEELIRQISLSFDYVRIINAVGQPQSVTEACDRLGICRQYADIVRSYEESQNRADLRLPKNDPEERFIDEVEMELLKYYETKTNGDQPKELLELITSKLGNALSAQLTS